MCIFQQNAQQSRASSNFSDLAVIKGFIVNQKQQLMFIILTEFFFNSASPEAEESLSVFLCPDKNTRNELAAFEKNVSSNEKFNVVFQLKRYGHF